MNYWGEIELDGRHVCSSGTTARPHAHNPDSRSRMIVASTAPDEVSIRYSVGTPRKLVIDLYDMSGAHMKRLVDGLSGPGSFLVHWPLGATGLCAPAGVYVVRMYAADDVVSRTVRLMK